MLGDIGQVDQAPKCQDWGLNRATDWKLHFCLWPRTCFLTQKKLRFKLCYKGVHTLANRGETFSDNYYVDKHEFIIWNLTK